MYLVVTADTPRSASPLPAARRLRCAVSPRRVCVKGGENEPFFLSQDVENGGRQQPESNPPPSSCFFPEILSQAAPHTFLLLAQYETQEFNENIQASPPQKFCPDGFWLNYLKLKTNQTPKLPAKQMNNEQRSSCCCSMRLILGVFLFVFYVDISLNSKEQERTQVATVAS